MTWRGQLILREAAPVAFSAYACGSLSVRVDGQQVLEGRGEEVDSRLEPGQPLERPPGVYPIEIQYRSLPDRPARVQLWWAASAFAPEPIAGWHFKHSADELPEEARRELQRAQGAEHMSTLGCAACHRSAVPGVDDTPPGPSLHDPDQRVTQKWLLDWLDQPAKIHANARMPQLFTEDREGFVQRWLVAEHLLKNPAAAQDPESTTNANQPSDEEPAGDHRMGRRLFISVGCATCHFLPDLDLEDQEQAGQMSFRALDARWDETALAEFLAQPHSRYPDRRMPDLALKPDEARDIASYLLLWAESENRSAEEIEPPTEEEIKAVCRSLDITDPSQAAAEILEQKSCVACFPSWERGLLGPVTLAVHPNGHLLVGSITEPGWMAQRDRGGLFRVDYTGTAPFEIQTIHVQAQGFELVFTRPVDPDRARDPRSYRLEHFRYEYSGEYGSPELDRTGVEVHRTILSPDRRSVQLVTDPLVTQRVYMITADGVRSDSGDSLVHSTGAYTLNQVPEQAEEE